MIYFVTAREVGRVKIGFSADPVSRYRKMRGDSPVHLALERVTEGDRTDEFELHNRFDSARIHGEWFALTDEIAALMATCRDAPLVKHPGKAPMSRLPFYPVREAA